MKTPEDEAFEDIERKQGGGFKAKQAMAADKVGPFENWWYYEGSGPPQKGEDCEEHTKRMCQIAWSNGAYVASQPAQEPVAWMHPSGGVLQKLATGLERSTYTIPLYTAPPKREWVGLTDEEAEDIWEDHQFNGRPSEVSFSNRMNLMQAIEAKLKEKNT